MVGSGSGLGKLRVYGNGSLGGDDDIGMVGGELHCIIRSLRRQTAMERRMANARPTCMEGGACGRVKFRAIRERDRITGK
jgi:hypothetical protein